MAALAEADKAVEANESIFEGQNAPSMQGVVASGADTFSDAKPSETELTKIEEMRKELTVELATLASQPENVSVWKLLRFLRGYAGDVHRAVSAFRAMVAFRKEHNVDAIRAEVFQARSGTVSGNSACDGSSGGGGGGGGGSVASGNGSDEVKRKGAKYTLGYPNNYERFARLRELIGKGMRFWWLLHGRKNGLDKQGNALTLTDIGHLKLHLVVSEGLSDLYAEYLIALEEWMNLELHELSELEDRCVARHDIINVETVSFFQFTPSCYSLLARVTEAMKHYPESSRRITSCGNGWVAIKAWNYFIAPFVEARTKEKLRVFGTNFAANLGPWMDTSEVPKAWGGSSKANAFDALLRGGHGDVAVDDFADCEDDD